MWKPKEGVEAIGTAALSLLADSVVAAPDLSHGFNSWLAIELACAEVNCCDNWRLVWLGPKVAWKKLRVMRVGEAERERTARRDGWGNAND
jgi:hypothetical protein